MAHGSFKRRQLRTSILLILAITAVTCAAFYAKRLANTRTVATPSLIYEADATAALERYHDEANREMSQTHAVAAANVTQKAELVISGAANLSATEQLVTMLGEYAIRPTFFFNTLDITASREQLSVLNQAGYGIGVLGDGMVLSLTNAQGESVITNLGRASVSMQQALGIQPTSMLLLEPPPDDVLYASHAADIDQIYVASTVIKASEIQTQEDASQAIAKASYGSVICLQLSSRETNTPERVGWLLSALAQTDYMSMADQLLAAVESPAEEVKYIYTTERASALTFSGLGNSRELTGLLSALKTVSGKATFFISRADITSYRPDIDRILADGHALGIAVQTSEFSDAAEVLKEILLTKELIESELGYTDEMPLRPVYGTPSELLKQAAAAGGFTLLGSNVTVNKSDYLRETDAQVILDGVLPDTHGALQRGEVVHFQMNWFQQSDTVLGELIELIIAERNVYLLRPAMDIINNSEYTYTYPLPEEEILPEVLNKIYPGQLVPATAFNEVQRRYIGIDWVDRADFLPGFSRSEIRKLDKTGLIANEENMVFLTFDDWGTDATITGLLDVLKNHGAKATFFVRTGYVQANPNLLRAIAEDGHAIGSHTDSHYPLANDEGNGKKFSELRNEQVEELKADLVTSYNKLQSIVGDIEADGKPALCRIFRPPTLAVGFKGLQAVLDCGFTYSVSAYYTSGDYKAENAENLAAALRRNTKSGSVIILHMSDNSIYTAEALDQYLTYMTQSSKVEDRFRYCRLTDGLPNPE